LTIAFISLFSELKGPQFISAVQDIQLLGSLTPQISGRLKGPGGNTGIKDQRGKPGDFIELLFEFSKGNIICPGKFSPGVFFFLPDIQ
jgi:hypothetical protein